jgi:hypothetical protein
MAAVQLEPWLWALITNNNNNNIQTGSEAQLSAYLMSTGGKSGWGVRVTIHVSSI